MLERCENSIRGMHYESLKLGAIVIQAKGQFDPRDIPVIGKMVNRYITYVHNVGELNKHHPKSFLLTCYLVTLYVGSFFLIAIPFVPILALTESGRFTLFYTVVLIDKLAHTIAPKFLVLLSKIEKVFPFLKRNKPAVENPIPSNPVAPVVLQPSSDCSICFGDILPNEVIVERPGCDLRCRQFRIHKHCFDEWKKQKDECPRCRTQEPEKEIPFRLSYYIYKSASVIIGYTRNGEECAVSGDRLEDTILDRKYCFAYKINSNVILDYLRSDNIQIKTRDFLGVRVISILEPGETKYKNLYLKKSDNTVVYSDFDILDMIKKEINVRRETRRRQLHRHQAENLFARMGIITAILSIALIGINIFLYNRAHFQNAAVQAA